MTHETRLPEQPIPIAPQGTPPWILGAVFLFTTLLSSFTGAYLSVSGDVREYLKGKTEVRLQEIANEARCNTKNSGEMDAMRSELSQLRSALLDRNSKLQTNLNVETDKSSRLEAQIIELQRALSNKTQTKSKP